MAITHLTKDNFDSAIANGKVVVDFWATWCGPCRMQAPILDEFDQAQNGAVSVCKVDVDAEPELAARAALIEEAGGRAWTQEEARRQHTTALAALDEVPMSDAVREHFVALAEFVVVRER